MAYLPINNELNNFADIYLDEYDNILLKKVYSFNKNEEYKYPIKKLLRIEYTQYYNPKEKKREYEFSIYSNDSTIDNEKKYIRDSNGNLSELKDFSEGKLKKRTVFKRDQYNRVVSEIVYSLSKVDAETTYEYLYKNGIKVEIETIKYDEELYPCIQYEDEVAEKKTFSKKDVIIYEYSKEDTTQYRSKRTLKFAEGCKISDDELIFNKFKLLSKQIDHYTEENYNKAKVKVASGYCLLVPKFVYQTKNIFTYKYNSENKVTVGYENNKITFTLKYDKNDWIEMVDYRFGTPYKKIIREITYFK